MPADGLDPDAEPAPDALRPAGQEAIDQGLRQLESAALRQGQQTPASREARMRLGQEAVANLESGIQELYGQNEISRQATNAIRQRLAEPVLDLQLLRRLRQDIERLQRETQTDDQPAPEQKPEKSHMDTSRFPPAYRKAIQRYFEKLSEQP
jgi:hypothetical protein